MRISKILRYIFALLLCSSAGGVALAQTPAATTDSTAHTTTVRGIQYVADTLLDTRPLPLFAGISVSGDVAGAVMAVVSSYGQYEAACRVNLRGRYFPIVEVGYGVSDHTDESTDIHYKTSAPYFRIGCDYNFARDRRSGNRILGGLRYGFTSFDYDVSGPDIIDPVWGTHTPFTYTGQHCSVQWVEISFGLEAKIWSIFHLGWTFRYRLRLHNSAPSVGEAWYVPGYGRNDSHAISGTFNIVFDI